MGESEWEKRTVAPSISGLLLIAVLRTCLTLIAAVCVVSFYSLQKKKEGATDTIAPPLDTPPFSLHANPPPIPPSLPLDDLSDANPPPIPPFLPMDHPSDATPPPIPPSMDDTSDTNPSPIPPLLPLAHPSDATPHAIPLPQSEAYDTLEGVSNGKKTTDTKGAMIIPTYPKADSLSPKRVPHARTHVYEVVPDDIGKVNKEVENGKVGIMYKDRKWKEEVWIGGDVDANNATCMAVY